MFDDDFLDDDFRDIEDLLEQFQKVKKGLPHSSLSEEDFETLIDHFETTHETENMFLAIDVATTLFPFSFTLHLQKAEILIDHQKFGQAMRVLDQLEEMEPNHIETVFLRSDILLEQNRNEEAIQYLESKVEVVKKADKTEILLELSEIYDEMEEFDLVYETLKRVLQYQPNHEDALMRICFWTEINGKHEDSIELHQKIIDEYPYTAMAWYNLGVAYQGIKLYEKAIDAYEYCLAIDDKFEYAYRNQGDAYMQLKQFDKAIEVLETHMTIAKPEDAILEAIGYCWEKQKDYAKARQYYRSASQLNPKDDEIFYKIGETYTKEGKWEKAIKSYSVALHINKGNASYCMALGNCLMEMNSMQEALVCYLNAVQLRPDIKTTWQSLIKGLYTADYFEEALTQLIIAEEHCGVKADFAFYRAAIYLAMGKTKEAVNVLEHAISLNPKKLNALNYIDKEISSHPLFAEVLVKMKKKK
jgi:tetratricopeptide (TPR) repeat protein